MFVGLGIVTGDTYTKPLYPGEGITSHVHLLTRFADGIFAIRLGSETVMTFRRVGEGGRVNIVYSCSQVMCGTSGVMVSLDGWRIASRREMVWLKIEEKVSIAAP